MQLELFDSNNLEEFNQGTPRLVSFRDFNRSFCRRSSTIRFIPAKFGCTFNRR